MVRMGMGQQYSIYIFSVFSKFMYIFLNFFITLCALNIFGKNYQHFWQNILGKWEPEIVLFKPPVLSLILRILL